MTPALAIGDFSRATHLGVKTLRHYHEIGLLEPVDVDPVTGYRRYAPDQIRTAQVIRRFRDLEMPLEDIGAVLNAPDLETRNQIIAAHLARLEANLSRTQDAVASLRDLLERPPDAPVHPPSPPAGHPCCRDHRDCPAGGRTRLVPGRARRVESHCRCAAPRPDRTCRWYLRRRTLH